MSGFMAKLPDTISITWGIDDVIGRAKDMEYQVPTPDQAREILQFVYHNADAEIGVTWDTIDYWTESVLREKE